MSDPLPQPDDFPSSDHHDTPPPGGDLGSSGNNWEAPSEFQLSDLQLRAIELTLQGHNDTRISQMLPVSRRTLWQWKTHDTEYRKVLSDTRAQMFAATTDRYQGLVNHATAILANSLKNPDETIRFRAAQILINMAGAFRPLLPKPVAQSNNNDDDWPEPVIE